MINNELFLNKTSYDKVIDLLSIFFSNSKILETGRKDKKFCNYFFQLVSILKYFEDNCNFSEKKYFLQIEPYLEKFFGTDIKLQKYQIGTLKDYFVNLTTKSLINYCINVLEVERKILLEKSKVSLDTALNLVSNKISNLSIKENLENEQKSERSNEFPPHKSIVKKESSGNDLSNPKPTTSPFGPIYNQRSKELENFYPFTTKPKIVVKMKQWIGILSIALTVLTLIFLGILIISDYGKDSYYFIKTIKSFANYNEFIQTITGSFIFFTGIILFRGLYNFLLLPNREVLKYRFPVWSTILFFIVLFLNFTNFFGLFLKPLISNDQNFSNLLPSLRYLVITIITLISLLHIAIFILAVIGIFNNPTVDVQKVREKLENIQNKNSDNQESKFKL
ncbi:hypothetical protein JTY60_01960 [symbiont of Argiope bruennichi]|uniref:hypothetical protein n=1 Tax=symbiont of Argiope bruennichi TaxID=2810479 RepID=UPI003DA3A52C